MIIIIFFSIITGFCHCFKCPFIAGNMQYLNSNIKKQEIMSQSIDLLRRTESIWNLDKETFSTHHSPVNAPWWARVNPHATRYADAGAYFFFRARESYIEMRIDHGHTSAFLEVGFDQSTAYVTCNFPEPMRFCDRHTAVYPFRALTTETVFDKARALFDDPVFTARFSRIFSILVPTFHAAVSEVGANMRKYMIWKMEVTEEFLSVFDLSGAEVALIEPHDFVPLPWHTFDLAAFLGDDSIVDYTIVCDDAEAEKITLNALYKRRFDPPLRVLTGR